jgi:hypothetical protein
VQPNFDNFIEGLRTEATRINYSYGINWVLNRRPDDFLALAKGDRQKAEVQLIGFVRNNRTRVASATLVNPVMTVKSFLDYYEVVLNWKKISETFVLPFRLNNSSTRILGSFASAWKNKACGLGDISLIDICVI